MIVEVTEETKESERSSEVSVNIRMDDDSKVNTVPSEFLESNYEDDEELTM